jgi:prepilin-type processing-associated H-X9-DG protein
MLGGWIYYGQFGDHFTNTPAIFHVTQGSIYPYLNNKQVFICPDDTEGQASGDSYSLNSCTVQGSASLAVEPHQGLPLAAFAAPAQMMLLAEEDADHTGGPQGSADDGYLSLYFGNAVSVRHSGGSNVSFIDGHVKWSHFAPSTADYGFRAPNDPVTLLQTGGVVAQTDATGRSLCP